MINKNLVLCDANFCVLPIVEVVKNWDFKLGVIGSKIDDPAHFLGDESIKIDYSNTKLLLEYIKNKNYDGIVPGCNDRSYLSSSKIAEKMSFPGFDKYETSLIIHQKDKFKSFAIKKNYPTPKMSSSIHRLNTLNFPILIKPVDSFSGKGTYKAFTIEEAKRYWKKAKKVSKLKKVIAEEFIDGNLYSHSVFIKNKKILTDFFVNEYCTIYPYQVNSSNVSTLLNFKVKHNLRKWVEKFAEDLNLCDGLIHTQFISDNKEFYLIEVARRCPGDLYSKLIQKSTGINYSELYSMPFCGIELPNSIEKKYKKYISRHTVSVKKDCIYLSTNIEMKNEKIQNVQLLYSGEELKAAPYGKSNIIFVEHKNKKRMEDLTKKLKNYIKIESLKLKKVIK